MFHEDIFIMKIDASISKDISARLQNNFLINSVIITTIMNTFLLYGEIDGEQQFITSQNKQTNKSNNIKCKTK